MNLHIFITLLLTLGEKQYRLRERYAFKSLFALATNIISQLYAIIVRCSKLFMLSYEMTNPNQLVIDNIQNIDSRELL